MDNENNEIFNTDLIISFDDEGNEEEFRPLSFKKTEDWVYILAESITDDGIESEAFIFRCPSNIESSSDNSDTVLEQITEENESFDYILSLFEDEFAEYGIEY